MKDTSNKFRPNGSTSGAIINSQIVDFFRLLRVSNLLILIITLYLVATQVVYPPLVRHEITSVLASKEFFLLLFVLLCLGAGAYVHNDIVDIAADQVNNRKELIGKRFSKGMAYLFYTFLTLGPYLALLSISMETGQASLVYGYTALAILLWVYNRYLKRLPIVGNFVVAFCCGFAVWVPYLVELQAIQEIVNLDVRAFRRMLFLLTSFSIFAFIANFIREIVKDMEDYSGDIEAGYQTLPIAIGLSKVKNIVVGLSVFFSILIVSWTVYYLKLNVTPGAIGGILVSLSSVALTYFGYVSIQKDDFTTASKLYKAFMLIGLIVLLIISSNESSF